MFPSRLGALSDSALKAHTLPPAIAAVRTPNGVAETSNSSITVGRPVRQAAGQTGAVEQSMGFEERQSDNI